MTWEKLFRPYSWKCYTSICFYLQVESIVLSHYVRCKIKRNRPQAQKGASWFVVGYIISSINKRDLDPERFASLSLSITTDNGCEFSDSHAICTSCITDNPRTVHYSAHPYCASERRRNENANRFIRRFFPKDADFSRVSQKNLFLIALCMISTSSPLVAFILAIHS